LPVPLLPLRDGGIIPQHARGANPPPAPARYHARMTVVLNPCPGCAAGFAPMDGPTHRYMASSPGCWAAFGEVLAREYADPALFDIHRLSVDAYAVQHPGTPSRQSIQSVGLHLCRLILQLERGLAPQRANAAMLALGRGKQRFTWLEPPPDRGAVSVADVRAAQGAAAHADAVQRWARAALAAWSGHRPTLDAWLRTLAP
jgi:hypothetical protein